jgi:hypothetical protein
MKTILTIFTSINFLFLGVPSADANLSVSSPTLEKIYVNSDSMQAVLYWTPSHSVEGNPILDYAATIDGANFFPLFVSYQNKFVTTVSLPNRVSSNKYFFAVAPILQSGLGPVSNYLRGEVNPYLIPIEIDNVISLSDGFSFSVKDMSLPGYSTSVQYSITDIIGNDSAYVQREGKEGKVGVFSIRGLNKGERATVTLHKRVGNCPGFTVVLACPFSTAKIINGQALGELEAPRFGASESLGDGFKARLSNFDPAVNYVFKSPPGVTVTIDDVGNIEVRGLDTGMTIQIEVTSNSVGFSPRSATLVGKSLSKIYKPMFNALKSTSSGFTLQINNYDPKLSHRLETSIGRVSINSVGIISVTGLGSGVSAIVKILIYEEDVLIYESNFTGKSLVKKASVKR